MMGYSTIVDLRKSRHESKIKKKIQSLIEERMKKRKEIQEKYDLKLPHYKENEEYLK